MNCPHDCKTELEVRKGKGPEYMECPKCQCTFRFVLIKWTPKCYAKFYKDEKK